MTTQDTERGQWTSCSSAEADKLCLGRFKAQKDLPELPAQEWTESGERIHAQWTCNSISGARKLGDLSAEEIDKAEALAEAEDRLVAEYFSPGVKTVRLVETRIWHEWGAYDKSPGADRYKSLQHSGRFDVAHIDMAGRRAAILDGKSGWLEVTQNPSNLQLRELAAMFAPWVEQNLGIVLQEVAVAILKPFGKPQPPCVYGPGDLEQALREMEATRAAHNDPGSPRTPGEAQCRYCRAREVCLERQQWLAAALPTVCPPLPMISADNWTPEQRTVFCERMSAAGKWLEDRKVEIRALLKADPNAVPGYGLGEGRTLETIIDPTEVHRRFIASLGGSTEAFMPAVKVQKGALKDAIRAVTGHKGRELDKDVHALLTGCTESKQTEGSIVKL